MGRPKFRITVDNVMHAARYLEGRLCSVAFVPRTMSLQEARSILSDIAMSPKTAESAQRLQIWCDDNLEPKTMTALKIAIRKRKQRLRNNCKVLTVSANAYSLLKKLATRDNVTLSKAIQTMSEKSLRTKAKH